MTFILGLTGSIGMGKSTTAAMFADDHGIPVWNADDAVHRIYAAGGVAVPPIAALVPTAVQGGAVCRVTLRQFIKQDPDLLGRIEAVVHPLVAADRARFLAHTTAEIAILDIPLLFENGTDAQSHATLLVTAPPDIQRQRVLARPGMTAEDFATILARQMPDAEKRSRANHIVETLDLPSVRAYVAALTNHIRGLHA